MSPWLQRRHLCINAYTLNRQHLRFAREAAEASDCDETGLRMLLSNRKSAHGWLVQGLVSDNCFSRLSLSPALSSTTQKHIIFDHVSMAPTP